MAPFAERARKRKNQGDFWWELSPRQEFFALQEQPKIIYPIIARESRFALDAAGNYLNDKCFFISQEDDYLLGILNSSTIWFYLQYHLSVLGDANKKGRLELRGVHMKRIPIPPAAPDDHRQTIERCVKEALVLAPQEAAALRGSHEQQQLRRRLDQLDAEIDQAVCALYGLTEAQKERVLGVTN